MKGGPELYYFDTTKSNKSPFNAYSLLSTIKDNTSCFSQCENEGADRDHDPKGKIVWIYIQYYQHILYNERIINTIVTVEDINRAEYIYGKRVTIFKGKISKKEHKIHRICHASHYPV